MLRGLLRHAIRILAQCYKQDVRKRNEHDSMPCNGGAACARYIEVN